MYQVNTRPAANITLLGKNSFTIHKQARSFYNSNLKKWMSKKYEQTGDSVISCDPDVITIDSDDDSSIIDCDQNCEKISNTLKESATRNETCELFKSVTLPETSINGYDAGQNSAFCTSRPVVNGDSVVDLLLEVGEDSCDAPADDSVKESGLVNGPVNLGLPFCVIEIDSDSDSSIENVVQIPSSQNNSPGSSAQNERLLKPLTVSSMFQQHINHHSTRQLNLKNNGCAHNLKMPSNFQVVFTNFCGEKKQPCINGEQLELNVHNSYKIDQCVQQNNGSSKLSFTGSSWHMPVSSNSSVHGDLSFNSSLSEQTFGNISRRTRAKKNSDFEVESSCHQSFVRPRQLLPKLVNSVSVKSSVTVSDVDKFNGCALVRCNTAVERTNKDVSKHTIKKGRESRYVNKKAQSLPRIHDGTLKNGAINARCKKTDNEINIDKEESKKERKEKKVKRMEGSIIEKQGERPVAKVLMDLGMKLVSKEVITGIIKASKKSIDINFENKEILSKYLTELKWELGPFQFSSKVCLCNRFKSESSNILLMHQEHGASFRIHRCCFCSKITKFYRSFYQHMEKRHQITASKLPKQMKHSCSLCSFETNAFVYFQSHQKHCMKVFCENKNLYPCLEDFDIPVRYNDEQDILVTKQILESAKLNLKAKLHSHLKVSSRKSAVIDSGRNIKLCNICGKSFLDGVSLSCHIKSSHRRVINKKTRLTENNDHYRTKKFTNRQATKMSYRKTRLQKHSFKCCFCSELLGKDIFNHIRYKHHISLDVMVKKRYCYLCEHSVDDVGCFESHMLSSHSELFPNYKLLWKQILSSFKSWRRNLSIKYDCTDGNYNKPWRCIYCEKRFMLPSIGYRHFLLIHTVEKIECQVCGKMISSGPTYTEHIKHHLIPCRVALHKCL